MYIANYKSFELKLALALISLVLITACHLKTNYVTTKTEIVSTGNEHIEDTNFIVPKGILYGKWREFRLWEKQGATWTELKPLNLIFEYEFHSPLIVNREVDIEHSVIATTDNLRGSLTKSRNGLILYKNQRNDTIFRTGELVKKQIRHIHFLNDSLLRMDEHINVSPGIYKPVIVDYRRI